VIPSSSRSSTEELERRLATFIESIWNAGIRTEFVRLDLNFLDAQDYEQAERTGDISGAQPKSVDGYYVVEIEPFDENALHRLPALIQGGYHR
jgi:hypothetical protein